MGYKLLIVESPAKAKTISGYLKESGTSYYVMASRGHIKNLPANRHGIEIEDGVFKGEWVYEKDKKELISEIKEKAGGSDEVIIATDGDPEGERIGSDIIESLSLEKSGKPYRRVIFTQITKSHIIDVLENQTGSIDKNSVKVQMARRMIDREIGYPVSSILKKSFEKENSEFTTAGTGRVIAPSLGIIVDAEKKREAFVSEEYRKIYADYVFDGIQVRLTNKVKYFEESETELEETIEVIRKSPHIIKTYDEKFHNTPPPKPLTTATLQRGAWYLFGFDEPTTMKMAQKLFEGINVYGERVGLITYMRTDSYNISDEATKEAIRIVLNEFGEEIVLMSKREYENKKNAHNSHEAIRPTMFEDGYLPKKIQDEFYKLEDGENLFKLYSFIYNRFLALQMQNAIFDHSYIEIEAGGNILSTRANSLLFSGWQEIGSDILASFNDEHGFNKEIVLPEVQCGEEMRAIDVDTMNLNTRTPDRYGRGRFITTLENKGIGRPSTMATIIPGLINKKYVKIDDKMLVPTLLGRAVHEWTEENCGWLCDVENARTLEEELDEVEQGELDYNELIGNYHQKIKELELKTGCNPNGPTKKQIESAQSIAKANGQVLSDEVLSDKKKLEYYLDNAPKGDIFMVCPHCEGGQIYENNERFGCDNRKCNFVIWKNRIEAFATNFKKDLPKESYREVVERILHDGKTEMYGLTNKKGEGFGALVNMTYSSKFKNYQLNIESSLDDREDEPKQKVQERTELEKELADELARMQEKMKKVQADFEIEKEERRVAQRKATTDQLTRAYNRTKFGEDIGAFESSEKDRYVAFIDGDKFKTINDTYGHDVGDKALQHIASSIFDVFRERRGVSFYRWGGEEFIVLLEDYGYQSAEAVLEEIRLKIGGSPYDVQEKELFLTVSVGWTNCLSGEKNDDFVKRADEAVYDAKENGRNRLEYKAPIVHESIKAQPERTAWL